jgi:hypothetical protein
MRWFLLFGFAALVTGSDAFAQEGEEKPDPVFDSGSLQQLLEFVVDEDGYLRLRQHDDEEANEDGNEEKEKEETPKQQQRSGIAKLFGLAGDRPAAIARARRIQVDSPTERLFDEVMVDSGARGSSSSGNGIRRKVGRTGPNAKGQLIIRGGGNARELELSELKGTMRSFLVSDSDQMTRFLMFSPENLVLILRDHTGVRVSSVLDEEVQSLAGKSFAELVQNNKPYFTNQLANALEGLVILPLQEAGDLEKLPAPIQKTEVEADNNGNGGMFGGAARNEPTKIWSNPKAIASLTPLIDFHLSNRRLRLNRALGRKGLLDKEQEKVRAKQDVILAEAIDRLKASGATPMQIAEMRRTFRRSSEVPQNPFGMRGGRNEESPISAQFDDFRSVLGAYSSGGSWGRDTFSRSFSYNNVGGEISEQRTTSELTVYDQDTKVRIADKSDSTQIIVESDDRLLIFTQSDKPARCTLLTLADNKPGIIKERSLVALIKKAEASYQRDFVKPLTKLGFTGLDPFDKELVAELSRRLTDELPQGKLSTKSLDTAMDSRVVPLLNDPEYLAAAQDYVGDEKRSILRKRIIQLRRAESKR